MINKIKCSFRKEDRKMLRQIYRRSLTLSATFNYERMQGLGFLYAMIPAIKRFWRKSEDRSKAYRRHFELFNTTPNMSSFIIGLSASMEKEASRNPDFNVNGINAAKSGLMGPFAGIGDSLYWRALRVITLGIGSSLAVTGNILGAVLHLLLFNFIAHFTRYYGGFVGFEAGPGFLRSAVKNGVVGQIAKTAAIVGIMTVGAMTCTEVKFSIPLVVNLQGAELSVQKDVFDTVLPGLLPLLLTFGCYRYLSKGLKPIWLMLILTAVGILGTAAGIF